MNRISIWSAKTQVLQFLQYLLKFSNTGVKLGLLVTTISLSFDSCGRDCGLEYSFVLCIFYGIYAFLCLRAGLGTSSLQRIVNTTFATIQYFIMFAALIMFSHTHRSSAEPTILAPDIILDTWSWFIQNCKIVITLLEGFASLLTIQAVGQLSRWCANNKSDAWLIGLLFFSASLILISFYFLWMILISYTIASIDAMLIGVIITVIILLSAKE